jgi:kynurenine formamidase
VSAGEVRGNWGRWGADDQVGALNLVTPEVTRRAVALVREGRTLSLAQPLGPASPAPPHRPRPARFMDRDAGDYALGARTPGGFRFAEDTVQFPSHSGTHVDALSHAWAGEQLYNGHPQSSTRSNRGAQRCGAENLVPVATRGVLVDLVAATGGPLPPSAPVGPADIERAIAEQGVSPEPGDAVLLRTGWWEARRAGGSGDGFANEPGITGEAAEWLAARDVAIVGADNYAVEVQTAEPGFPAHLVLLHRHGVPLIENLELAGLAAALGGRSTFLLVFAPLPLVGSTGSPVTPVAVL